MGEGARPHHVARTPALPQADPLDPSHGTRVRTQHGGSSHCLPQLGRRRAADRSQAPLPHGALLKKNQRGPGCHSASSGTAANLWASPTGLGRWLRAAKPGRTFGPSVCGIVDRRLPPPLPTHTGSRLGQEKSQGGRA
ncbi:hypothetical protein NDU88_003577 [Pleurodeles waltl]|uniref:Uncharacterized protein n=1 Tax=Pleurodeles waltl TaxID=8319 RepID=A0AAV7L277_PLEWA|nr:hypothetical protein NDU88_003577 [Pleurodeles waltl]